MKRLTTDNPQDIFETMMNMVYGKDGWQYIRHGYNHMKTTDFCLKLCEMHGCKGLEVYLTSDEAKDEHLCDCLFAGCPIAAVYAALCGYGHVRDRLKMYEDAGIKPPTKEGRDGKPKVIAVDFDGCLCEDKWPEIGQANFDVIRTLIARKKDGDKLILWTCREGEALRDAVAWCAEHGLDFDAVNDNLPERTELYGNNCRKVGADEYWDDRAVLIAPVIYGRRREGADDT